MPQSAPPFVRPSLVVYTEYLGTNVYYKNFTKRQNNWRRTHRNQGGAWQGSFTLEGDILELSRYYYTMMGYDVREQIGDLITWRGLIFQMDLTYKGVTMRRTLDLMTNKVKVEYIDEDDENQETSWAQNLQSQAIFGVKEEALSMDQVNLATANSLRDRYLFENAWAQPKPLGIRHQNLGGLAVLDVRVTGYAFTTNYRYTTQADEATSSLSQWIEDIVTNDMEFIGNFYGEENAMTVNRLSSTPIRAWDLILDLVELGDTSGSPWRFWVDNYLQAHYAQVSTTPTYYWNDGILSFYRGGAAINPWFVEAGVVRDMNFPIGGISGYSGFLEELRDLFIDEVEVNWDGTFSMRTGEFSEVDILAAQSKSSFLHPTGA